MPHATCRQAAAPACPLHLACLHRITLCRVARGDGALSTAEEGQPQQHMLQAIRCGAGGGALRGRPAWQFCTRARPPCRCCQPKLLPRPFGPLLRSAGGLGPSGVRVNVRAALRGRSALSIATCLAAATNGKPKPARPPQGHLYIGTYTSKTVAARAAEQWAGRLSRQAGSLCSCARRQTAAVLPLALCGLVLARPARPAPVSAPPSRASRASVPRRSAGSVVSARRQRLNSLFQFLLQGRRAESCGSMWGRAEGGRATRQAFIRALPARQASPSPRATSTAPAPPPLGCPAHPRPPT